MRHVNILRKQRKNCWFITAAVSSFLLERAQYDKINSHACITMNIHILSTTNSEIWVGLVCRSGFHCITGNIDKETDKNWNCSIDFRQGQPRCYIFCYFSSSHCTHTLDLIPLVAHFRSIQYFFLSTVESVEFFLQHFLLMLKVSVILLEHVSLVKWVLHKAKWSIEEYPFFFVWFGTFVVVFLSSALSSES